MKINLLIQHVFSLVIEVNDLEKYFFLEVYSFPPMFPLLDNQFNDIYHKGCSAVEYVNPANIKAMLLDLTRREKILLFTSSIIKL